MNGGNYMIYIVRHGQTDWNMSKQLQGHNPIPINENGRKEADIARTKIEKLNFDKIISSDLLRAIQTTQIINKYLSKDVILDSRLRSVDYGTLEGRFIPEILQEEWDLYNSTPSFFNAESTEDVYFRIKNFFDEQFSKNENVLIVAHGGTLRIISYYLKYRNEFIKYIYETQYKNAKQPANTALFEIDYNLTALKPIYY
mgnify:CR=1 FL=1